MSNQATGNTGAADGHQQSIGADSPVAVDGIAGSNPGTQQPSGAHVDAGAGPAPRPDQPARHQDNGVRTPSGTPVGGLSGMSGQGVAQPKGATGVLGSHAQERSAHLREPADPMYAGNWTGSIARGGKMVAVQASSGSLSRQHSSGT